MRIYYPIVGGPRSGEVYDVDASNVSPAYQLFDYPVRASLVDYPAEPIPPVSLYDVRPMIFMLPGRTDRQAFNVLAHPSVRHVNDPLTMQIMGDAVKAAWAKGWAPPDSTSEDWPRCPWCQNPWPCADPSCFRAIEVASRSYILAHAATAAFGDKAPDVLAVLLRERPARPVKPSGTSGF